MTSTAQYIGSLTAAPSHVELESQFGDRGRRRRARFLSELLRSLVSVEVPRAGRSVGGSESCTRKRGDWGVGTWPNRWDSENERSAADTRCFATRTGRGQPCLNCSYP